MKHDGVDAAPGVLDRGDIDRVGARKAREPLGHAFHDVAVARPNAAGLVHAREETSLALDRERRLAVLAPRARLHPAAQVAREKLEAVADPEHRNAEPQNPFVETRRAFLEHAPRSPGEHDSLRGAPLDLRPLEPWVHDLRVHADLARTPRDELGELGSVVENEEQLVAQWRKHLSPVRSIATPRDSAAAIDSSSRTDPPGCAMAAIPALAAISTESGNGKKASEQRIAPRTSCPERSALRSARRTASTLDDCPAPIPSVRPSRAITIALEMTCRATRPANPRSRSSASVGRFAVTVIQLWNCGGLGGVSASSPPRRLRVASASAAPRRRSGTSSTTRFLRIFSSRAGDTAISGASTTSRKVVPIPSSAASSSGRFSPRIPPNAESGSASRARASASATVAATAAPAGFRCFTTTAAGSSNS